MKVLVRSLATRLQRLSPLTITAIALSWVVALGVADFFTPGPLSLTVFYLFPVALAGWGAGKRHAWFVSAAAVVIMVLIYWVLHQAIPHSGWVALWNNLTRLLVFCFVGWLAAEIAALTRGLEQQIVERTARWKTEAEEHKSTTARLTEALDRFEQVITSVAEVFWLTDVTKNQMVYVSPGYERIWGRKCEALYREPKSWLEAIHPADRDAVARRAHTDQALGNYDVEYRILRPDGSLRWIRDRAFPVRNTQGEVCRIAGIADDITERKQTREVLQTQAAILENMAEGVVVTDERGVIVQMNPAGERIWGYERNEAVGQPVSVLSGLSEPEATAGMREVLETLQGCGSWRGTFNNRRKDGGIIACEAVIRRVEIQGRVLMVAVEQDVTERLRAQEQLQMQAHVLESMAEAVLMVDEQGTIVLTNPAQDALLGYERGELLGHSMLIVAGRAPEDFRREFARHLAEVRVAGSATKEYVARRKDGTLVEVETRSSGVISDGRFFLVIVGTDITQRKRAEQALRQSQESLRVFLDAVPAPAFLLDREGKVLVSNPALAQSLGVPMGDLKGRNIHALLPTQIGESRQALFDQVVRDRKPVRFEDERAGRHFLTFESPVLDPVGNVSRVAVVALDITERKQAERALARKEELYRTLFELSPDGILLEDTSGTILDANQALCLSFGYTREELLGRNVRCLVPPDGKREVEPHLAALRAGKALEHEVWNIRKNGERCLVRLNEKPLALPDGRQGILVIARDITEGKRVELTKAAFLSLGAKLSSVRTPVEAARAVYATADQLWQWDCGALSLYSPESDCMEPVLFYDVVEGQRREVPPVLPLGTPTPRTRRIMRKGAELILRKETEIQDTDSVRIGDTTRLCASIMAAPLRREGQPVGVLYIQSYTPNAYSQDDLRTLQALADYCAGALERIRAELVLRESEQKYRALVETTGTGFLILDMAGRVLDANAEYVRLSGHKTLDEIRGRSVVDWTAPTDRQRNAAAIEECLKTGAVRNLEIDYAGPSGPVTPTEISGTVVQTRKGGTILSLCRDITQRKQAERIREAFLSLGAKLSAVRTPVEAARAVYATADQLWQWDSATFNLYAPESDSIEPVLYYDILDGERVEVALPFATGAPSNRLRRIMQQGAELTLRKEGDRPAPDSIRFGDSSRPSVSIISAPMRLEGQPIGIVSIHSYRPNAYTQEDLQTMQALADHCAGALERIRAEVARQQSEELVHAFYDSPGGLRGVVELTEDDILVLSANAPQAAVYGRTVEDLRSVRSSELGVPRPIIDLWRAKFRESQARGQPVTFEYSSDFRSPGTWGSTTVCALQTAHGARPRFAYLVHDITDRKRAEQTKEAFLTLGAKLSAAEHPIEAARAVYATADQLWQWDSATLDLCSPDSDRFQAVLNCDVIAGQRREVRPARRTNTPSARMRRILEQGAELILEEEPKIGSEFVMFGDTARPSASMMYVPLRREGQAVGVLSIQSYTPNAYTQEDLRTLQALADHCGGALERIQAEQALRQREELNRSILATTRDGFYALDFTADPGGAITEVNEAFCRLTGYPREELLRMRMADLEAKESPEEMTRHKEAIMAAGTDRFETCHRRKDGQEIQVEISLSRLAGEGERVFGFVRDITERKQAELMKEAFLSLGARLSAVARPVEAARALLAAADQLWKWDSATLDLYSPERDWMEPLLFYDIIDGQRREVAPTAPAGGTPGRLGRVLRKGAELILRQPADMQSTALVTFGDHARLSASLMFVPLRRDGQAIGVLSLQSYTPDAYTQEDLRTLQALADYCGGALERIRAEVALREAHDKLEQRVKERTAELQAANAALAASEARLRLALDASNAGAWSWDASSNTSMWDNRYHELYGFEPHEPRSHDAWLARVHPEDRERLLVHVQTLLGPGGGDVWDEEFRALHPVKGERWMAGLGRIERDQSGRAVRFTGINLDITERKQAEQALRQAHNQLEQRVRERTAELQAANAALSESEERYRSLVNNLNVGVYRNRLGNRGSIVSANPALARMHGYDSVEELQRVRVADLYQAPRERDRFLVDLIRAGSLVNYELRLKKKDRTPFSASVNATLHRDPNGEVAWIDGVLEDITQRKQAQEALRASEERYRTLAESSPDAIFILDRALKVGYANSMAAALWRRKAEDLIGLTQSQLFPPETAQHHEQVVREVFDTGKPVRRDEPLSFPVGDQWIEIRLAPLCDAQGAVTSVMGVCRDITERKRAERQLAEALDLNQRILEASPMGIVAFKASGECVFTNQAMAGIVGGTVPEILQQNFRRLQTWQKTGLRHLAEETLRRGQPGTTEVQAVTSFGKELWADVHMAPFTRGNEPHLLCMLYDTSDRKRAELALRQAERLQKAILDNIPDPVWLKDARGRFLAGNQALAQFYGRAAEAIVGKTVRDCLPREADRLTREDRQVMRTRSSLVTEALVTGGPGRARWFESIKAPVLDEQGKVAGTVGIARDITERKRAETLLHAQRDLGIGLSLTSDLAAALKHLLDIAMRMGGVDSGGVYLLNPASGGMDLVAHHGVSPAFVKAVSHWAPDGPQMRLMARARPVFARYRDLPFPHDKPRQKEGLRAIALLPLCHNTKVIGALSLASHLNDEIPPQTQLVIEAIAAQAAGAIARLQSENARRSLEQQVLEISDRQQARIGQDIHDGLSQQLVSLAFDANSLQRQFAGKNHAQAKTARRIARYLDRAITEARQLSRGLFPVRLATEGLPPALEELANTTRGRFKIRCRFSTRGPVAAADSVTATHLYRIAQEAVTNAVKHSQARSVSIRLRAHARQLELSIEDNGTGLSALRRSKATGLGLHIMDYRARAIGGTLRLGRGRRGGTLVYCCVPRQRS